METLHEINKETRNFLYQGEMRQVIPIKVIILKNVERKQISKNKYLI